MPHVRTKGARSVAAAPVPQECRTRSVHAGATVLVLLLSALLLGACAPKGKGKGGPGPPPGLMPLPGLVSSERYMWEHTFGGTDEDRGSDVIKTRDGGLLVVGSTSSEGAGGADVYLVRTNEEGEVLWTNAIGGEYDDHGHAVVETPDGGFMIVGTTASFGAGGTDVYLVRTDGLGAPFWSRTFGGPGDDAGNDIIALAEGGYALTGSTHSASMERRDAIVLVVDEEGNELRAATYGGLDDDEGFALARTADGGFVIAGNMLGGVQEDKDVYLVRTDAAGGRLWELLIGGGRYDYTNSRTLHVGADGSIVLTGATLTEEGMYDVYLLKTDAEGSLLWSQQLGGKRSDVGHAVLQVPGGGYLVAGATMKENLERDVYLLMTNPGGELLWSMDLGKSGDTYASAMVQMDDGGVVVVGSVRTEERGVDVYLAKVGADRLFGGMEIRPGDEPEE